MAAAFSRKKIEQHTRVCFRLKAVREKANLSIDELSRRTKIAKEYLIAIEECRFDDLPVGNVYRKHFICRYLKAVGVSPKNYLAQFEIEEQSADTAPMLHRLKPSRFHFHNLPGMLRSLSIAVVVIACFAYLGLQVKRILEPPQLTIHTPTNGEITEEGSLIIRGETDKEAAVAINGSTIITNPTGHFEQRVELAPGMNTITIKAQRRHGKAASETRFITLKVQPRFTLGEQATHTY